MSNSRNYNFTILDAICSTACNCENCSCGHSTEGCVCGVTCQCGTTTD